VITFTHKQPYKMDHRDLHPKMFRMITLHLATIFFLAQCAGCKCFW